MDRLQHAARFLTRVVALLTLANLGLGLMSPGLDGNWLWIGVADPPTTAARLFLAAFAAGICAYPRLGPAGRATARVLGGAAAFCCLLDAMAFYRLLALGRIQSSLPVPFSLPIAASLALWAWRPEAPPNPRSASQPAWRRWLLPVSAGLLCVPFGLWVQIQCFGATDYRRPADAIVVFGARVNRDGQPSLALHDRVKTACRLYREGYAKRLVLSGGRGPGAPISEPEAMRDLARAFGVPDEALLLDEQGVNTLASVGNAAALSRREGWTRLLMVSHDYHLSRIKLLSRHAGISAFTVPAEETRPLRKKPFYILRELAAWMYYYT
jgi:vancomycin permeability regulator SanA